MTTGIDGLKIKLQKAIWDERGVLCEVTPEGMDDPFLKAGLKNIHASTATKKHVIRGGHYHNKAVEVSYTLGGTALWIFSDTRKNSKTFGKTESMIISFDSVQNMPADIPVYATKSGKLAQILIPSGVYHAFLSLKDEPAIILALASQPYSAEDTIRMKIDEVPGAAEILEKCGIVVGK